VSRSGELLLAGRVLVLSPHLDDAVFSLGAALAEAARAGAGVTVLTVLAGDPGSGAPAGPWDARAGFATAGEAASARREEDRAACAAIGAAPDWLPYGDAQYGRGTPDDAIWAEIAERAAHADALLVPGFPLANVDHSWLAELVLARVAEIAKVAAYVEQPYATWYRGDRARPELLQGWTLPTGAAVDWRTLPGGAFARLAKHRALLAYRTQLAAMARPRSRVPLRIAVEELRRGGERAGRVVPRPMMSP
jgi:LmbE family N-acetylglucosaminyl deacetylase